MFTYERSVRYPEGHRNVVFPYRGVRTLPRLPISDHDEERPAPDTQMLYRYLHYFRFWQVVKIVSAFTVAQF